MLDRSNLRRKGHHRGRRISWIVAAVAAVVTLAVMVPAWAHQGHGTGEVGAYDLNTPRIVSDQTAEHIGLKTAEVDIQPIEEVIELSGIVKPRPDRQYTVISLIEGQVLRVLVRVGDQVKAGQIVAEIESLSFLERWSQHQKLEAQTEALQLEHRAAVDDLKRTQALAGTTIPRRELAQRKAELAQTEVALKLAQIEARQTEAWLRAVAPALDLAEMPHNRFVLRSAIAGYVVHRDATPGMWAEAGQGLIDVADYSVVQIEGELPESLIVRIRNRQSNKVRIRAASDPSFLGEGTVRFISPELDAVKRTAHLIIDAPNDQGVLRGEMWVNLSIVLREVKEAIVIPRKAQVVRGPLHFVFVYDEDEEHYVKQDIVTGVSDDRYIEVTDGLLPGDVVVVEGAYSLTHLPPSAKPKTDTDAEASEDAE